MYRESIGGACFPDNTASNKVVSRGDQETPIKAANAERPTGIPKKEYDIFFEEVALAESYSVFGSMMFWERAMSRNMLNNLVANQRRGKINQMRFEKHSSHTTWNYDRNLPDLPTSAPSSCLGKNDETYSVLYTFELRNGLDLICEDQRTYFATAAIAPKDHQM